MTNDSNQSRENAGSEVLLIEDDVAIRDHIRTILSERHSTVLEAESTLQIMKLIDLRSWNWRPPGTCTDCRPPSSGRRAASGRHDGRGIRPGAD